MTPPSTNQPSLWLYPNLLGLDAPAVAIAWQWLFAHNFGITIPPVFHLILGLSAWCIYLADRIYDVLVANNLQKGTDRMKFTFRNIRYLLTSLVIAASANLFLIIKHVPLHLIVSGLATASLLAIYYAFRFKCVSRIKSIIPRELLCGMLFALGCAIAPHAFGADSKHPVAFWISVSLFGLVCSSSCILISVLERDEDLAVNDSSIATEHSKVSNMMCLALPLLALLCIVASLYAKWQIPASVALAAFALFLMLHFQDKLSKALFRVLADAVLLTPLIFIWF